MQIEQNVFMHDLWLLNTTQLARKQSPLIARLETWLLKQLTVPKGRDWVVPTLAADLAWEEEDSQPSFDCVGVADSVRIAEVAEQKFRSYSLQLH